MSGKSALVLLTGLEAGEDAVIDLSSVSVKGAQLQTCLHGRVCATKDFLVR